MTRTLLKKRNASIIAAIAEKIDGPVFNRSPDTGWSEQQLKDDLNREQRAMKKATDILDWLVQHELIRGRYKR